MYDWAYEAEISDSEFYSRGITHGRDSAAEGRGCLCGACAPQEYEAPEDNSTPEEIEASRKEYEDGQAKLEAEAAADTSPF